MGHARRSGAYRDPARRAAATGASPVAGATHGRGGAGKGERRPEGAATHGDRRGFWLVWKSGAAVVSTEGEHSCQTGNGFKTVRERNRVYGRCCWRRLGTGGQQLSRPLAGPVSRDECTLRWGYRC